MNQATQERKQREAQLSEKRRKTALHEAGHAVIARAAGFTVNEVSLHEEGGGVCWVEARTRTTPEDIKRELSWVLAGRLAVALEAGEYLSNLSLQDIVEREANPSWPGSSSRGLRGYRRSLEEILPAHRAPDGWLADWLPVIRDETARVLRERWSEVVDLATRLGKHGRVDLAEARSTSPRRKPQWARMNTTFTADPLRRSGPRLQPNEIARCLRFVADTTGAASEKAKVQSFLYETGYEVEYQ